MKLIIQCTLFLLLSLCFITIGHGTEAKLNLSAAELLLSDIEADRNGAIQQRIAGMLKKYEAIGLSEKFPAPVLSFMAACSAEKMVEIEESMTAEQLVDYANDVQRSSADDDKIAAHCLEHLQDLIEATHQQE